ncbi:MAG: DUF2807 domain-containing protein [Defluviitaleaceae bacterium]|nr:DUF2807 domain-containing protein [Defluviitaleaceae bacterium]
MKKFLTSVFVLAASLLVFAGCDGNIGINTVRGTGSMNTHTIDASDFTGLNISGAYYVTFRQADDFSVTLEIQDNLMNYVETSVRGGVFHLGSTRNFNTARGNTPRLYVYAPTLDELRTSGAVSANVTVDLDGKHLEIHSSGAADITLVGSADSLDIRTSGASNVDAFEFIVLDATINVSGAGDVRVYASNTLDANISGAGTVRYDGNPSVSRSISGAGSIRSRN